MSPSASNPFEYTPIEKVRTYWNSNPCNFGYSRAPFGTKEYFDDVERERYIRESHIPAFADFEKWRGKRVLEIGCGMGTDTINFARHGAFVTAVDLSEKSLEIARQRAQLFGLQDFITFFQVNAEELSKALPKEKYDLIYSFGVIHHTPHPENVLSQLKGYTHPDTVLKIMVYHRYSWAVLWILLKGKCAFWKLDDLIAKYSESQNCPIIYTYSKSSVKNIFHGYEIQKISVEFSVSQANHFITLYRKSNLFFHVLHPVFSFFGKPFGWHLCITAKPTS